MIPRYGRPRSVETYSQLSGQSASFIGGAPRRDVIGFRTDDKHGQMDCGEIDPVAFGLKLATRE